MSDLAQAPAQTPATSGEGAGSTPAAAPETGPGVVGEPAPRRSRRGGLPDDHVLSGPLTPESVEAPASPPPAPPPEPKPEPATAETPPDDPAQPPEDPAAPPEDPAALPEGEVKPLEVPDDHVFMITTDEERGDA